MFYIDGNILLTINLKHFYVIESFDLNFSSNSLFKILSIKDVLVDFLMCLCISFIAFLSLKLYSSGLILINSQASSFSIVFCLFIS